MLWLNWRIFTPNTPNPFDRLLFLSHPVPLGQVLLAEPGAALRGDTLRYQKGYDDLWFVAYYLVVLSCVRQTTTLHIFKPFARWWGITNQRKQDRFIEQAYALLYWGLAGAFGVVSGRCRKRGPGWLRLTLTLPLAVRHVEARELVV